MNICVYGASSTAIDESYCAAAYRLGELMAKNGHALIYGGGGRSVMGAVARGVHENGGHVTGVAPRFFTEGVNAGDGVLYAGCDEFVYTDTMRQRKQTMDDLSDGFIAAAGGLGTIEELVEILTLKQLGQQNKPLVLLNTNGLYDSFRTLLSELAEKGFMKPACLSIFSVADTPEEALSQIESYDPNAADVTCLKDVT
jgi:uncharacterized protein (TIGR00730 family)